MSPAAALLIGSRCELIAALIDSDCLAIQIVNVVSWYPEACILSCCAATVGPTEVKLEHHGITPLQSSLASTRHMQTCSESSMFISTLL
jgi:hypothetical protein